MGSQNLKPLTSLNGCQIYRFYSKNYLKAIGYNNYSKN